MTFEIDQWIQRYERIAVWSRKTFQSLGHVFRLFDEAGIEFLPLKGMDLLLRGAYGGLGHRPTSDVDLLVHEKDLSKIPILLEKNGFSSRPHSPRFIQEGFVDESFDYVSEDLILDFSWNVWYLDSPRVLWEKAVLRETPLGIRRLLRPEDSLLYLIAHVVIKRGRLTLVLAQDIEALITKETSFIDWDRWTKTVKKYKLVAPILRGLDYAAEKGIRNIPKTVFDQLRPWSPYERWLVWLYSSFVTEDLNRAHFYLRPWFGAPGWKSKWCLLKRVFLPSRMFVELRRGKLSCITNILVGMLRPFRVSSRALYFILQDLIWLLFLRKRGSRVKKTRIPFWGPI